MFDKSIYIQTYVAISARVYARRLYTHRSNNLIKNSKTGHIQRKRMNPSLICMASNIAFNAKEYIHYGLSLIEHVTDINDLLNAFSYEWGGG